MGVTNSRYPEEICEGQIQINQGSMMGLLYDKLDVSTEDMENVDLYMQSLGVPARRNVNDPEVKMGERMFYEAKCHLCHVTTLHTRPRGSVLVNGHTCFLHDGRARNFVEAIMWHGGEGEASRNLFKAMTKERRDALVKFLESL